ncbi:Uncharacterised protein [Mycobacteroides abscessus]|nr:Uncharacterised protein [Mycobacteroides abscessus]
MLSAMTAAAPPAPRDQAGRSVTSTRVPSWPTGRPVGSPPTDSCGGAALSVTMVVLSCGGAASCIAK